VRSEICPHLTSLKIIFQIGVVGKNVPAAHVNFKQYWDKIGITVVNLKLYTLFLMVTRSCKNDGLFLCIMKNPGVYRGQFSSC
jgi:hypothetical protein